MEEKTSGIDSPKKLLPNRQKLLEVVVLILIIVVWVFNVFNIYKYFSENGKQVEYQKQVIQSVQQNGKINNSQINSFPTLTLIPTQKPIFVEGNKIHYIAQNPYYRDDFDKGKTSFGWTFDILYNRKQNDIVKLLSQDEGSVFDKYSSGLEITRENTLKIKQVYDSGSGVSYFDNKPQYVEFYNTKLGTSPIYRLKDSHSNNIYKYVTGGLKFCPPINNQENKEPILCHSPQAYFEKLQPEGLWFGFEISCQLINSNPSDCDEIMKSLQIFVTEIKK